MSDSSMQQDGARVDVVIGIIRRDGLVLISRRRSRDAFGDLWEFPGGKREPDEPLEAALHRELQEELGISVRLIQAMELIEHDYPAMRIRLHPWICQATAGEPRPLASEELRWIEPAKLTEYRFPEGNARLLERVAGCLADLDSQRPRVSTSGTSQQNQKP